MPMDAKTTYAKSSDIKGRSYLEYRRDMKRKAIAELEMLVYLPDILKKELNTKNLFIKKWGGDKFLWFLRKGGITREPDFLIEMDNQKINETQYAIFAMNLLEDIIQDLIYNYDVKSLQPIKRIFENLNDFSKTYNFIKNLC